MEKSKKNFKKEIVKFVNAWSEVLELKNFEHMEESEDKKIKMQERNKDNMGKNPNPMYAYIYNWLELSDDIEEVLKPHRAKKRYNNEESRKLRENDHPIAADIVDYFCDYPTGKFDLNEKSIDGAVRRALSELVQDELVVKCDQMYFPVNVNGEKRMLATQLDGFSNLKKRCFFSVSKSTYIIYFNTTELSREKEFFKNFYGEDCFDVFTHENRLFILFKGNLEACKKSGIRLRETVRGAYARQEYLRRKAEKMCESDFN